MIGAQPNGHAPAMAAYRWNSDITTATVVATLPAVPDSRLSAPSSASMNSSAFFSAASEMPGGSPARAGILSDIVPPPASLAFRRLPRNDANTAPGRQNTRPKAGAASLG